jgi:hypothetical protein
MVWFIPIGERDKHGWIPYLTVTEEVYYDFYNPTPLSFTESFERFGIFPPLF